MITTTEKFNRFASSVLYSGFRFSGLGRLFVRAMGRKTGILAYHNVLPDDGITGHVVNAVDVSVSAFRRQLEYLERKNVLLSVDRLHEGVEEGFFLTFDDGMLNNFEIVAPILREFGVRALFSVCPGLITGDVPYIWKDHFFLILRRLRGRKVRMPWGGKELVNDWSITPLVMKLHDWVIENGRSDVYCLIDDLYTRYDMLRGRTGYDPLRFHPMTEDMVRQLAAEGHVIGSHTWSHRILSTLSEDEQREEFSSSKAFLDRLLERPVRHIVYPYGGPSEVDEVGMRLAREVGYDWGFVNVPYVQPGPADMNMPRFALPNTTSLAQIDANLFGLRHALKYALQNRHELQ